MSLIGADERAEQRGLSSIMTTDTLTPTAPYLYQLYGQYPTLCSETATEVQKLNEPSCEKIENIRRLKNRWMRNGLKN